MLNFLKKVECLGNSLICKEELNNLYIYLIDYSEHLELKLESSSNLYFSVQDHRMNQFMKALIIVSIIFMLFTFIAGLYEMN